MKALRLAAAAAELGIAAGLLLAMLAAAGIGEVIDLASWLLEERARRQR